MRRAAPATGLAYPTITVRVFTLPGPEADMPSRSLDHLIGACEDRYGDGEAERLGGPEVDRQFELAWMVMFVVGYLCGP
jgi:hypothetical protein